MLHEYAVEPELAAMWGDRKSGRYFLDKFGLGSPRIMSRYPPNWEQLVWAARRSDSQRKRTEELIQRLSEVMVTRQGADWNPDRTWLENTLNEHRRIPFHAIVVRGNPAPHSKVLVADELDEHTSLWSVPHETIPRTAAAIAGAVRDMLRMANDVVFIDPYFAPQRPHHTKVLAACFRACLDKRLVREHPTVRVFTAAAAKKNGTRQYFEEECRARLPRMLPRRQRVTIARLEERSEGEKLHNRYILTEFGGVGFPAGLGEEHQEHQATDDPWLLTRKQHAVRWSQYVGRPPAFDQPEDEITVVGTARR